MKRRTGNASIAGRALAGIACELRFESCGRPGTTCAEEGRRLRVDKPERMPGSAACPQGQNPVGGEDLPAPRLQAGAARARRLLRVLEQQDRVGGEDLPASRAPGRPGTGSACLLAGDVRRGRPAPAGHGVQLVFRRRVGLARARGLGRYAADVAGWFLIS